MRTVQLRKQLHHYIDSAEDKKLKALYTLLEKDIIKSLIDNSVYQTEPVQLSEEQITMLKLSDKDIEAGDLIPHDEVSKSDLQWLKEL